MAALHPQIVHFTIALLFAGVLLRCVSLLGRPAFVGPAAATLLLVGTLASVLAVKSGDDAHGPVERVPGARAAVVDHEEWGERTRNVFLGVAALEIAALLLGRLGRRERWHKAVLALSAVAGLGGAFCLYEAGEHGGELVYDYAGGVGIRSGDPQDVGRLLLAGLYHQALQDRRGGNASGAASLIEEAERRYPDLVEVRLLAAESRLLDRRDPAGALSALDAIEVPADSRSLRIRHAMLRADALDASGDRPSAMLTLETLLNDFPGNTRVTERLATLKEGR